jgi:hypothetical protein
MHRKLLSSVREKQRERNMVSEIFGCISIDIYFFIHFCNVTSDKAVFINNNNY